MEKLNKMRKKCNKNQNKTGISPKKVKKQEFPQKIKQKFPEFFDNFN